MTHSEYNYSYFPYVRMGSNESSLVKRVGGRNIGGGDSGANGWCGAISNDRSELSDEDDGKTANVIGEWSGLAVR